MTSIHIQWGLKNEYRPKIADILYNSFSEKFPHILGPTEKGTLVIAKALRNDRVVLAMNGDVVAGLASMKYDGKEYLDLGFWFLIKEYKHKALKVIFNGMILESKIHDDELCLDTLAVAEDMRGLGIGTHLVNEVIGYAREIGKVRVKLWVVDTNPLAKKLYERIGFKEGSFQKIPFPWSRIFAFSGASELTYEL